MLLLIYRHLTKDNKMGYKIKKAKLKADESIFLTVMLMVIIMALLQVDYIFTNSHWAAGIYN